MKLVQGNQLPVSNYEPRTADKEGGEDELRAFLTSAQS
jgi:hypothetical protein